MDEMYEIVHQATYKFFGNDEMYKLVMDEICEIVLVVKPTLMSLFRLFGLCFLLFGMYDS